MTPNDNAMAETVMYKTECVRRDGPLRTVDDLQPATLFWVHWFDTNRLHSTLGYVPPAEDEEHYYRQSTPRNSRSRENAPPLTPVRFRGPCGG